MGVVGSGLASLRSCSAFSVCAWMDLSILGRTQVRDCGSVCVQPAMCVHVSISVCVMGVCVSMHFEHVYMNRRACLVGDCVV